MAVKVPSHSSYLVNKNHNCFITAYTQAPAKKARIQQAKAGAGPMLTPILS